ncbi:hypothetical protein SAMN02746098_03619 [Desulfosporosinus lacus DSM 15449]|uniref:Uncharacterized protein n=2 Tax=Desulfosporosinus TaxID=79206 RepID=A0A1M5ZSQ5_9FIRM|nr:hypothetical protein SAMN02746098_03619 [Desulfosporosinus lacus DSM 15449]
MFLAMNFTIDANTDTGAFVTPDGKEKIEVYEGQFDGRFKDVRRRAKCHHSIPGFTGNTPVTFRSS